MEPLPGLTARGFEKVCFFLNLFILTLNLGSGMVGPLHLLHMVKFFQYFGYLLWYAVTADVLNICVQVFCLL